MKYILNRLKEPSTWSGISLFLTAIGVSVSPEMWNVIVPLGMATAGFIGVALPDQKLDQTLESVKTFFKK